MSKMIQIRDVPEELHRTLKARAATRGMSLSDYLKGVLTREASRLTPEEMRRRLEALPTIETSISSAEIIRRHRDAD
jgi:plasmid stability protein